MHATRMQDMKSLLVKKALNKESIKLSAMAREHIPNHEQQVNRPTDNIGESNLMVKTRIRKTMEHGMDKGMPTIKEGTPIWGRNKGPSGKLDQVLFGN